MQRHGQVLPPCRCIARIALGEYICRRFLRERRGRGGGEIFNKIDRGAHLPRPKSFSCFWALFLKAREAPLKKRKRSETARHQFWFWIKIRFNPIYLVIFFMVAPSIYIPLLALTDRRNHRRRNEYTRFAWAGGTFFPVVLLCQFFVLAGNRFWFYILLCT